MDKIEEDLKEMQLEFLKIVKPNRILQVSIQASGYTILLITRNLALRILSSMASNDE